MKCKHRMFRFISHTRGSQDGIVCIKCRGFWKRERQPFGGSAYVYTKVMR